MTDIGSDFPLIGDASRPGHHQWGGDTAFVNPSLMTTKGRVRRTRPTGAQAEIRIGLPGWACGSCPSPRIMISALAPLSERKMTNVLSSALRPCSSAKEPADFLIQAIHHRGVDGHFGGLELLLSDRQRLPGNFMVHFSRP